MKLKKKKRENGPAVLLSYFVGCLLEQSPQRLGVESLVKDKILKHIFYTEFIIIFLIL